MATPKVVTNGVTEFDESLNKFLAGDGVKTQIKTIYASIIYDTGVLVVDPDLDSCGIVTGDLSYNGTSDQLEITISGFTNPPHVQCTRRLGASNYPVAAEPTSNTEVVVEFYDPTDLSAKIALGSPDANMNFFIEIKGE